MQTGLMAHLVAGYPDMEQSFAVATALARGGADYIEAQFPFSDPGADGPVIERACQAALDNGFTVADGFAFMARLREAVDIPLFVMTYGSLVFARGTKDFCRRAREAGVDGLIVPDLPPDYSEGLFAEGAAAGLAVVPVIAPGIADARLRLIGDLKPEYIYTALRLGITGGRTRLDGGAIRYLDRVSALGAKVVAGFGVRTREQMEALSGHAHAAAVGSFFLELVNGIGADADVEQTLIAAVRGLKGL